MRAIRLCACLTAGLIATTAHADDNTFTSADVLAWNTESQDSFFQASVGMATVIASQDQNPAARCINDWYFKDDAAIRAANDQIRETMRKYTSYYPGTVIVAVIERECGDLTPPR